MFPSFAQRFRPPFLLVALAGLGPFACAATGLRDPRVNAADARVERIQAPYEVPPVTLIDQDGLPHFLPDLLSPTRPIVLNFVFTTCTTICPVMTATFSQVVEAMEAPPPDLRLVSISLDPEYDTPEVLRAYAKRFGVRGDWRLLTGAVHDVRTVLDAFEALSGSKMSHRPYTYARAAGASTWTRIEGLIPASDLARELETALQP